MTLGIYALTSHFPKDEMYGLTNQMRRASVSIAANIAEGCGKDSDKEFSRYLQIAMGSSSELEYELILAHDLNYVTNIQYQELSSKLVELRKMVNVLISKVRSVS